MTNFINIRYGVSLLVFGALLFIFAPGAFAQNSEKEQEKRRRSRLISYSRDVKLHEVKLPNFEKQAEEARKRATQQPARRSFLHSKQEPGGGTDFHQYRLNQPEPRKKPEEEDKKKKNWILPPVPDDLKNKYSPDDKETTGWGWLADMVLENKKEEDSKKSGRNDGKEDEEKDEPEDRERDRYSRDNPYLDRDEDSFDSEEEEREMRQRLGLDRDEDRKGDEGKDEISYGRLYRTPSEEELVQRAAKLVLDSRDDQTQESSSIGGGWAPSRSWSPSAEIEPYHLSETDSILSKYSQTDKPSKTRPGGSSLESGNGFTFDNKLPENVRNVLSRVGSQSSPTKREGSLFAASRPSGSDSSFGLRDSFRPNLTRPPKNDFATPKPFSFSTPRTESPLGGGTLKPPKPAPKPRRVLPPLKTPNSESFDF